jgi:phosphate transport system permease protein
MILAVMIVPYVTSVATEVFQAVPPPQREAALALGATRWEMIRTAVLPYGRTGVIGAVMLGLGRAIGETMAVTMVIGNRADISVSLFAPGSTMASVIANEFSEATYDLYVQVLVEIGLVLFVVTVVVNVLARLLVWRVAAPAPGAR